MRRSSRRSALAALLLAVWPASIAAQSAAPGALEAQGDRGGRLSVGIPPGAAPSEAAIDVVPRDPSERPEELMAVPMRAPFFELQPSAIRFGAPVTVTRSISFEELGIDDLDPLFDGLVVGSLLTRDAGGTWSWLADVEVRLDLDAAVFTLTATTDHGGPIFTSVAGDVLVATEDDVPTPVGETFRVEGQLRVDPDSRADIMGVTGRTSDEAIATPGASYDLEGFEGASGLEYACLARGTVTYETTFSLGGVDDIGPLSQAIGLPGAAVAVTHAGEHTCA